MLWDCRILILCTVSSPFHCSGAALQVGVASHFPHVSLSPTSGPISGVLRRHLMTSLIHSAGGVWPSATDPMYRMVQWVSDIWSLYNVFLDEVGLSPMASGKHQAAAG